MDCFKTYDVRGKLGTALTPEIATRIGFALDTVLPPGAVVVGFDCRPSSAGLAQALAAGLSAAGRDVVDIGMGGTEEVYFATDHLGAAGGVEITASHNPADENGMKFVGPGSRPLSDAQFQALKRASVAAPVGLAGDAARVRRAETRDPYAARVADFAPDAAAWAPLHLVVNAGNGTAGAAFDAICDKLTQRGARLRITRLHHRADGRFPNGIPNPLLPENQPVTGDAVRAAGADLGIAWDGDFDRCFFFDEAGDFIDGQYVVALLAAACLGDDAGAAIVHDHRVVLNTRATIARHGGRAVRARTGHAFMKRAMREADAVYGGEMSAHHYFRDFMFCDSGMVPWLKLVSLLSARQAPLSALVADMRRAFPASGEINFRLDDPAGAMARVAARYGPEARACDDFDGLSLEFDDWRLNLRPSGTEALLRLNVETRGDKARLDDKVAALRALITGEAQDRGAPVTL